MEFQCKEDDAWYDVKLFCNGKKLRVHYADFSEDDDEEFDVKMFKDMEDLEEFRRRFRKSSVQIQDQDCHEIYLGKSVCALCYLGDDEVKFYDATVVEVLNEEHKFKDGEEECCCFFVVRWENGPLEGERTFAKINDLCILNISKKIDPSLFDFLEIARERVEKGTNEQMNLGSDEDYFEKQRRMRKNRFACRTLEGRIHGGCKRIRLLGPDVSTASSL